MSNEDPANVNKQSRNENKDDSSHFYRIKQSFDVLIRKFETSLEKFNNNPDIPHQTAAATAPLIAENVSAIFASATNVAAQDFNNNMRGVNKEIGQIKHEIKLSYEHEKKNLFKITLAFSGGSIIVCVAAILIHGWYIEKNYNQHILKAASFGEAVARAWPKLTKHEQEKILRYGQEPK